MPAVPATFMVKVVGALLAGAVTTVPDCLIREPDRGGVQSVCTALGARDAHLVAGRDGQGRRAKPGSLKVVVVGTSTVTSVVVLPVLATFMVKVVECW